MNTLQANTIPFCIRGLSILHILISSGGLGTVPTDTEAQLHAGREREKEEGREDLEGRGRGRKERRKR